MSEATKLTVNGATHMVDTSRDRPLLDILREDIGLTGCKIGCGEGACGACTVLVDGQPTRSLHAGPGRALSARPGGAWLYHSTRCICSTLPGGGALYWSALYLVDTQLLAERSDPDGLGTALHRAGDGR
jgi:2Fe-2S iron-sulfur cluster protein